MQAPATEENPRVHKTIPSTLITFMMVGVRGTLVFLSALMVMGKGTQIFMQEQCLGNTNMSIDRSQTIVITSWESVCSVPNPLTVTSLNWASVHTACVGTTTHMTYALTATIHIDLLLEALNTYLGVVKCHQRVQWEWPYWPRDSLIGQ